MPPESPPPWLANLRGRFIVFDGPDGGGKSTQFRRFARFVEDGGVPICEVREPGGTAIGEQVRKILLDPTNKEEVDIRCEMLLFMASRTQLVAQRIRPARNEGKLILADRFISSTLAYQGAAGGLPLDDIRSVGRIALGDCWPDLTVIFDVDENVALQRMNPLLRPGEFSPGHDRMELKGAEFHRTVRRGYLDQAKTDPGHYLVVDAAAAPDTVFEQLLKGIEQELSSL